jgi:hypothetical protein
VDYAEYFGALAHEDHELAHELGEIHGMGGVLTWMMGRGLDLTHAKVVAHEENAIDFIVPLDPGGRHLVFGITSLGGLTAVALWHSSPTKEELRERRLRDGWQPASSRFEGGQSQT